MTNEIPKPPAPANRADLKTWTPAQLEYAAPFWVAKLQAWLVDDAKLVASIQPNTQLHLDALGIQMRKQEQLTYWKLIQDGIKTYRVLPPSLRTFYRNASYNECGLVMRSCTVGAWDKADGIWSKTL
jgi:hypothetical protein